jgi:hypothetical protein
VYKRIFPPTFSHTTAGEKIFQNCKEQTMTEARERERERETVGYNQTPLTRLYTFKKKGKKKF